MPKRTVVEVAGSIPGEVVLGKINPEKACEELKRFLESRKGMCVHVHIKLPRCNLNDEE